MTLVIGKELKNYFLCLVLSINLSLACTWKTFVVFPCTYEADVRILDSY